MADVVEPIEARNSALTAPIPGAKPGGDDLSFDTEFEKVKAEVEKLGAVTGQPNWEVVATISSKLLSTRTKDMRLATWNCVARMHRQSWTGLADGLVVLRAHCDKYWDTMFPERRPRARANLFGWLIEQVANAQENKDVTISDGDSLAACEILFKDLDDILGKQLGEMHPGLGVVRRLIATRLASVPKPPEPTPADEAGGPATESPDRTMAGTSGASQGGGSGQVIRVAPPQVGTVSSVADVDAALSKCEKAILSAARALFQQDPARAWAYFLSRTGAWLTIGELPEAQGSTTFVPPPDPGVVADLQAHAGNARWADLLRQAEGAVGEYPFWLDLHFWVARALDTIGGSSKPAAAVVAHMTLGFVDRFPNLVNLQFSGGMPFAGPDTSEWLNALRSKGGGGGASDAALEADKADREAKLAVAREAIAAGRIGDGVGLMVQLARRSPDARTAFRLELDAAKLALEAQKPGVSRPILEGLLRQIDVRSLETWDPELCVSVYAALLSSLRATNPPFVDAEHREAVIIEKICRLDPALAVRMGL